MKKVILGILIASALCAANACIDDSGAAYNYMEGTITFDIDDYVCAGSLVELSARGITDPVDPEWGWVISTIQPDTLFAPSIIVQFPKEPDSYEVKALAYHPNYIVESTKKTIISVDTTFMTGSLQGLPYDKQKVFVDRRDLRAYRWEHIGNLDWFAENLAWEGAGEAFAYSRVMNHVFGRLYTWQEASGSNICPDGWRLPTNADWEDLGKVLCGGNVTFENEWAGAADKITPDAYFNGERLWPFSVNNTHDTKQLGVNFNPLPCGYMQTNDGGFYGLKSFGMWWSATPYGSDQAYYRYIYWDSAAFMPGATSSTGIAMSVRCVR